MSFENDIKLKISEITRELESDRELQLDVEMELENHLLESYESSFERGLTEEEREKHALKEFGSIIDIKEKIVLGNLKRMKKRSRLKLMLWYIFIPLSIIYANALSGLETYKIYSMLNIISSDSRLLSSVDKDSPILNVRNLEKDFTEEAYERLQKSQPKNGYLNFIKISNDMKNCINTKTFSILDEVKFKELLEQMKIMVKKSSYNTYRQEELNAIKAYSEPGFTKMFIELNQGMTVITPDIYSLSVVGEAIIKRGFTEEIKQLEEVCRLLLEHSETIFELNDISLLCSKLMENQELSENIKNELPLTYIFFKANAELFDLLKAEELPSGDRKKLIESKGSLLANVVFQNTRNADPVISEEALKPSREMEYNFYEKIFFMGINAVLFIITFLIILILLVSRYFDKSKSIFVIMSLKEWSVHLSKTIILPISLYQVYKLLPFASVKSSLIESGVLWFCELLVLTIIISVYSTYLLFSKYKKRLEILSNKNEENLSGKIFALSSAIIFLFVSVCFISLKQEILIVGSNLNLDTLYPRGLWEINESTLILIVTVTIVALSSIIYFSKNFKSTLRAQRSLASGILLNLSFTILILSLYSNVYLQSQEEVNYEKDTLIRLNGNATRLTTYHDHLALEIKELFSR